MRRSFPTFRFNNVIRLCAFAMAMCFVMSSQRASAAAPRFHSGPIVITNLCYNSAPFNLSTFLGVDDSDAGNDEIYSLALDGASGGISPLPVHTTALGPGLSAFPAATISFTFPASFAGADTFKIRVTDGTTADTITFVFNIAPPPVAFNITGSRYLYVGDSAVYSAGGTGGSLYWVSSNPAIATVHPLTGAVHGLSAGNVIISDSVHSTACGDSMRHFNLSVLPSAPPTISSVGAAANDTPGAPITINGSNFDTTYSNNTVFFGGVQAQVTGGSTTSLTMKVPYGALNTNVSVLNDSSRLVVYDKLQFTPRYDTIGFDPNTWISLKSNQNIALPSAGSTTMKPYSVETADLDGDGRTDLIVTGTGTAVGGGYNVLVYKNIGLPGNLKVASFSTTPQAFTVGAYPINAKIADLDGDGKPEIIVACSGSGVSILRNTSTTGTISFATRVDKQAGVGPSELTIADFDGDGRPDIGVNSVGLFDTLYTSSHIMISPPRIGSFMIIENHTFVGQAMTTSSFVSDTMLKWHNFWLTGGARTDGPLSIVSADFDNDGRVDVAIGNQHTRTVTILKNLSTGRGSFAFDTLASHRVNINMASGATGFPEQMKVGDFDGDGKMDIAVANTDSDLLTSNTYNVVSILHNTSTTGTITFSKVDFPVGVAPVTLSVGDLNGDGMKDIVVANAGSASITILKNNTPGFGSTGTISFVRAADSVINNSLGFNGGPVGSAIVDLDSNMVPDIAVVCREANILAIFKHFPLPDTNTMTTFIPGKDSLCINDTMSMVSAIRHANHEYNYWKVTDTTIARIDHNTGVITGLTVGTDTVKLAVISLRDTIWVTPRVMKILPLPNAGTITGATHLCVSASISLTASVTGGTWRTTASAVASVDSATGVVSGIAPGNTVIFYYTTTPSCGNDTARHNDTVNILPDAGTITGAGGLCVGANVTLTESSSIGTWSSSNTTAATVSATGVVHGLAIGVSDIRYIVTTLTCGNDTAIHSVSVINTGGHTPITPATSNVCVGATETLSNAASGGTWSSSASGTATVDPATGVVTGVAAGTATISYIEVYTCQTDTSYATVTVNARANVDSITGPATVCISGVSTLTAAGSFGTGTWSSSAVGTATVGASTGVVHGVSAGTVTITYIASNACNNDTTYKTITVSTGANAGTISGLTTVCTSSTITLTSSGDAGGTWTSSDPTKATVNVSTGVVTGVAAGTTNISYTAHAACDTQSTSYIITVNPVVTAGTIVGSDTICQGSSITLTDPTATTGFGVTSSGWISTNNAIATIGTSTGVMGGVAGGSVLIKYGVTSACNTDTVSRSKFVRALVTAGSISGASNVCAGNTIPLSTTGATAGGTWSSTNTAVATVDPASGVVLGVTRGTVTISYTVSNVCNTASSTYSVTVDSLPIVPAITGATSLCISSTVTLSNASGSTRFSWASSNPSVATIDATGGLHSTTTTGITTITYVDTNACGFSTVTRTDTVTTTPVMSGITGLGQLCVGNTLSLGDATLLGSWTSTTTANATVNATGLVTGVHVGTSLISYTVGNGCGTLSDTLTVTVTDTATINPISGPSSVCRADTITLTDATASGVWTSSLTSVATISSTGVVHPVAVGTTTISYTVTNGCGANRRTMNVTVNDLRVTNGITGFTTICLGSVQTLIDTAIGGTWSSTLTGVATIVAATGEVHPVSTGTTVIRYIVSNGCGITKDSATITVTANTPIAPITGTDSLCTGASTTLSDTTGGGSGTWIVATGSTSLATVSAAGVVTGTGLTNGPATIYYRYAGGTCGADSVSHIVNIVVTPVAGTITGTSPICEGSSTFYTVSGGTSAVSGAWRTSNSLVATVNTTGTVSGVSGGTATISYVSATTLCGTAFATHPITVNPLPTMGTIVGPDSVCIGVTNTLTNPTSNNTGATPWSITGGTGTGTIDATTGALVGSAAGTLIVQFSASTSCGSPVTTTKTIKVHANPNVGTITGPSTLCLSSTLGIQDSALFTESVGGGAWSISGTGSVATVSAGGEVVGVAIGSAIVSYGLTDAFCGTFYQTAFVSIGDLPHPTAITGAPANFCVGTTVTLSESIGAGSWSLSNGSVLSITPITGFAFTHATATAAGIDTVTYSRTNGCGTATTSIVINTNAAPVVGPVVGVNQMCVGTTVTLTDTSTGGTWGSSNNVVAFASYSGAAGGRVDGIGGGIAFICYTKTNTCGTARQCDTMTVYRQPVAGVISGTDTICGGTTTTLINTGSGISTGDFAYWFSADTAVATVGYGSGIVTGANAGGDVNIIYADSNFCGLAYDTFALHVNEGIPNPGVIVGANRACVGSTTTMSDTITTGFWVSSNTSVATIGASTGIVTAVHAGTTTISYIVGNPCDTSRITHQFQVNAYPVLTSNHTPSVCDSNLFSYTATTDSVTAGWLWTRAGIAGVANVSGTDTVPAISEYLDNTTNASQHVKYVFTFSSDGCTSTDSIDVTVKATPYLVSPAFDTVCSGSQFTYNDTASTGTTTSATWVRQSLVAGLSSTSPASGTGGLVQTINSDTLIPRNVVYVYTLTNNGCPNTGTVTVTIDPRPGYPKITTHSPSTVCDGTYQQNFGANSLPPAGVIYSWSANGGASVWATGTTRQYSLVDFTSPGYSTVFLLATLPGFNCPAKDSFNVFVDNPTADRPEVVYFNGDFVCLSSNQETYQWGSDNVATLDSDLFEGQTNQNYYNSNPDFTHNYYWVMTSRGGCFQKSYYNKPTAVINVTANMGDVNVYPNPANSYINVEISNTTGGEYKIDVVNMMGQKITTEKMTGHKTSVDVSTLAAGCYFVDCYRDGIKFTTVKFIKN